MRSDSLRRLKPLAFVLVFAAGTALADEPGVTLEAPASLEVDRPAELVVVVRGIAPELPMLVRAQSEGSAIEVVRRSLVGAEGENASDGTRRFRIPVVARAPGTALVRVAVMTYRCEGETCVPLELEAREWLRVERR